MTDKTDFIEGEPVVAKHGKNEFIYDFGYYNTSGGCVVYIHGERNMQDSFAFKLNQVRRPTIKELNTIKWYDYDS